MFLRPQHFQQHDRWIEQLVESRASALRNHPWGFSELAFDRELLALGKLSIRSARAVFPDGVPVDIPATDHAPTPLDLDETVRDQIVYLCLPARRAGAQEYGRDAAADTITRYRHSEIETRDSSVENGEVAAIEIGKPSLRLLRANDPREDFVCLGVVRVLEVRADKTVILDETYIPPVFDCHSSNYLHAFMGELQGMLAQRGDAVAARVAGQSRGAVADVADFLMLLLINRSEPVVAHLNAIRQVHAEDFFRLALSIAGEAAAFTAENRRPIDFPPYRHDDLQSCFVPLINELRRAFSFVQEQRAVAIPLELKKYGIRVGRIADHSLFGGASFVLMVSAAMSVDDVRRDFPRKSKLGSPVHIADMARLALPGIALETLASCPREIHYHAGSVYFELDPRSDLWDGIKTAGAIALHVGGEFPELKLELWAIRHG